MKVHLDLHLLSFLLTIKSICKFTNILVYSIRIEAKVLYNFKLDFIRSLSILCVGLQGTTWKPFWKTDISFHLNAYCIAQNELEYFLKEPVSSFFYAPTFSRDIFSKTIHIEMLLKSKEIVRENAGARKQNIILWKKFTP